MVSFLFTQSFWTAAHSEYLQPNPQDRSAWLSHPSATRPQASDHPHLGPSKGPQAAGEEGLPSPGDSAADARCPPHQLPPPQLSSPPYPPLWAGGPASPLQHSGWLSQQLERSAGWTGRASKAAARVNNSVHVSSVHTPLPKTPKSRD